MKRLAWSLILLLITPPAFSANKNLSIQDLKGLLISLQQAKKSDAEVATQLKQIELAEELTASAMNSLANLVPGPLTTEQMYVLEARSAILPPPAADLPESPAPSPAEQSEILAKASNYLTKAYSQLPHLAATRMTARFQDGVDAVQTYTGATHGLSQNKNPLWDQTNTYTHLINTHTDPVESENGAEIPPAIKDKTLWGPNNMVASIGSKLTLETLMHEATTDGNPKWLRWELLNGARTAVFTFNVDKKKTHLSVIYCCFPNTDTTGLVNYAPGAGANNGTNLQTISEWKPFKANPGYRGQLFIDPETGIVLRTITTTAFKPTDPVHSETIRTDYAPTPIASKSPIVPVRIFTLAEVVPNGDSFAAKYAVRHSFITQNYTNYRPATAAASAPN